MDRVHYIWIDYTHYMSNGQKGSCDSCLVFNGDISLEKAKSMINAVSIDYCRQWMSKKSRFFSQKGVEVKMTAQNIRTSQNLYTKIIGTL